MPTCTTCGLSAEDHARYKGSLQEIAEAEPASKENVYEAGDLSQAKGLYALSQLVPTSVEMLAIALYSARLKERSVLSKQLEAADKLAEAARATFGPTKGKTGNERDDLDTALSAFYQARKA